MHNRTGKPPSIEISDDPLINQLHRRYEFVIVFAMVVFILYTTCLPTGFSQSPTALDALGGLSRQDVIQNLILYIPLGIFLALGGRRKKMNWRTIWLLVFVVACGLSCMTEFTQQFLPGRVSSARDILCNTTGGLFGCAIAYVVRLSAGFTHRKMKDRLAHHPTFITSLIAAGIFAGMWCIPFQFDLSPQLRQRAPDLAIEDSAEVVTARAMDPSSSARTQFDHKLDLAASLLCFPLLGMLLCWSLKHEYAFAWPISCILTLWVVLALTIALCVIEIFLRGRGFHPLFITVGCAGAMAGVVLSWTPSSTFSFLFDKSISLPLISTISSLGFIGARELSPMVFDYGWETIAAQLEATSWIPFTKYLRGSSALTASSDMLAKLGRFFVFSVFLSFLMRAFRVSFRRQLKTAWCVGIVLTIAIEVIQLGCPYRSVDITHVLLGCLGMVCGVIGTQWWLDVIIYSRTNRSRRVAARVPPGALPKTPVAGSGRHPMIHPSASVAQTAGNPAR